MADKNKQPPPPMKKPERPQERNKDTGNEDRKVQKDLDTDETDEAELDEQGEITQRNPRLSEDIERR